MAKSGAVLRIANAELGISEANSLNAETQRKAALRLFLNDVNGF
jgi:hypothetical protein